MRSGHALFLATTAALLTLAVPALARNADAQQSRNNACRGTDAMLSAPGAAVQVWVFAVDEARIMARSALALLENAKR